MSLRKVNRAGLYTAARSPEIPGCNQICRGCNLGRTGLVRLVRLVRVVEWYDGPSGFRLGLGFLL